MRVASCTRRPPPRRSDMTVRVRVFVLLILAVVVAGPVRNAAAGKGDKVTATANGRRVRLKGAPVCDGATQGGFSIVASPKVRRLGQVIRGVAIACPVDLANSIFPVSPPFCSVSYTETHVKRVPTIASWGASVPAVQVTVDSYDGTRMSGTFSGALTPEFGATRDATIA